MPGPTTPVGLVNVYTAIAEYHTTADSTKRWRNSYDFHQTSTPVGSDAFFTHLANFVKGMGMPDTTVDFIKVYNWSRGTNIYPAGLPIFTIVLNATGTANTAWSISGPFPPAGSEVCLRIDKGHLGAGKPGRFFFRNFLNDGDIQSTRGGRWTLVSGSAFTQANVLAMMNGTGIDAYVNGGPALDGYSLVTVQYSPKTHTVHGFQHDNLWSLIGPTTNKPTRKSAL